MPKMKTRSSVAKRFSITASGKLKFKKKGLRHILEKRSSASKRHCRKPGFVCKADAPRIKVCLPYA